METKKIYECPQLEVVELTVKEQLLQSSGGGNTGSGGTGPVERDAPGYSGEYEED